MLFYYRLSDLLRERKTSSPVTIKNSLPAILVQTSSILHSGIAPGLAGHHRAHSIREAANLLRIPALAEAMHKRRRKTHRRRRRCPPFQRESRAPGVNCSSFRIAQPRSPQVTQTVSATEAIGPAAAKLSSDPCSPSTSKVASRHSASQSFSFTTVEWEESCSTAVRFQFSSRRLMS